MSLEKKKFFFAIENENQVAYVSNRLISEGRRLVTDVLEVTYSLDIEDFLMKVDIEKACLIL